ncbi:hypothetical protein BJY52DRAFT_1422935 [Lactarius psammicola]|nr:hypothetical protein BJY52DRAFT_1422935 [Lactarius psammicola]
MSCLSSVGRLDERSAAEVVLTTCMLESRNTPSPAHLLFKIQCYCQIDRALLVVQGLKYKPTTTVLDGTKLCTSSCTGAVMWGQERSGVGLIPNGPSVPLKHVAYAGRAGARILRVPQTPILIEGTARVGHAGKAPDNQPHYQICVDGSWKSFCVLIRRKSDGGVYKHVRAVNSGSLAKWDEKSQGEAREHRVTSCLPREGRMEENVKENSVRGTSTCVYHRHPHHPYGKSQGFFSVEVGEHLLFPTCKSGHVHAEVEQL